MGTLLFGYSTLDWCPDPSSELYFIRYALIYIYFSSNYFSFHYNYNFISIFWFLLINFVHIINKKTKDIEMEFYNERKKRFGREIYIIPVYIRRNMFQKLLLLNRI